MSKKAIVTVNSNVLSDEDNLIGVVSLGEFYEIDGGFKVEYEETEISGMEGTKTIVIIKEDSFELIREGTTETKMEFERNKRTTSMYKTPYGILDINIHTIKLDINVNKDGGSIEALYILDIGGQSPAKTDLIIEIKI